METGIAVALLALGVGLFWAGGHLPEPPDPNDVGAAGFPRLVAAGLVLFAVPLVVRGLRQGGGPVSMTSPKTILFIVVTIVEVLAMPYVGYYPAASAWLLGSLVILGARWSAVFVTAGFMAFIWVVFGHVFGVPLP